MEDRPDLVIGAGMAGGRAAEVFATRGRNPAGVVLVGDEPERPYHRPDVSKGILLGSVGEGDSGDPGDSTYFRPAGFYDAKRIRLRLGERVRTLDPAGHRAVLESGEELSYRKLVLAPGTVPVRLTVPGADLSGVHYLRTLADARSLRERLSGARAVAVIGGGFVGTEVASACVQMGLPVTIVELARTVLCASLGESVGALVERRLVDRGIVVRHGHRVMEFLGTDHVKGVRLADGHVVAADVVVVGIGVRPDIDWLAGSGVETSDGIVVDEFCRTSQPDVYAAGDAVRWTHPWFGSLRLEHETNAQNQAMAAARNAVSDNPQGFRPVPYVWSDQGDLEIRYVGHASTWDELVIRERGDALSVGYCRDGNIYAMLTVNDPEVFVMSDKLMQERGPFPACDWSLP